MRKTALFILALALPGLAAADARNATADGARKDAFQTAAVEVCSQVSPRFRSACEAIRPERRILSGNIAEYSFRLRVGKGQYDVIGIHRVVKEAAPWKPAHTSKALMMAHGDIWNFRAAFLTDPARNLPVLLARNGIDVWGIDFGWTLVPATTTNFSFMKNWGIERDARDLGVALAFARGLRFAGGHGVARMLLLGWSRGGQIGYAYLDRASQLPSALQQVRGFIPVDIYLKTDVEDLREAACTRYQGSLPSWQAGTFENRNGTLIATIWQLATTNPNGASPILPGFTNRQASLAVGSLTFLFFPPNLAPAPLYHFTGGTFDAQGKPTGLLYTPEATLLALEKGSAPYQPAKELLDGDAAICDDDSIAEVGFDDHLDDIKVPVLYVGASGGFGGLGIYTTTLLGSTDVTSLVVDLQPPANQLAEFGHADIFLAINAEALVWQPILTWLQGH
jgi:pimeloyl-ACP methyl ester carboxylesterase